MYFFRNNNKKISSPDSSGKKTWSKKIAQQIGKSWEFVAGKSISAEQLLEMDELSELEGNNKIYLSKAPLYSRLFGKNEINAAFNSFFK